MVAAGGIYDGRGLAAALSLGADGVWCGTRFLMSQEAVTVRGYKQRLLTAQSDDTVLTSGYTGKNCRVLKNKYTDQVEKSNIPSKEFYSKLTPSELRKLNHLGKDDSFVADLDVRNGPDLFF